MNGGGGTTNNVEARYSTDSSKVGDRIAFTTLSEDPSLSSASRSGRAVICSRSRIVLIIIATLLIFVAVILAVYFGHPKAGLSCQEEPISTTTSLPPGGTTEDPGLPTDVRLPTDLIPTHYELILRPDIYQDSPDDFGFYGSVEIFVNATSDTNVVTLHYRNLEINDAEIFAGSVDDSVQHTVIRTWKDPSREFLHIEVSPSFQAGFRYKIRIMEFNGPITGDLRGIYYSSYLDDSGVTKYLLSSQLQPTDGRKVFPCMDEPALKATFAIAVERQEHFTSLSNTKIYHTEDLEDGWKRDHYTTTPPMSTYILAFIVSDFECRQNTTNNNKEVLVCARPNAIDQVDFALHIAVPMQEFFEVYHDLEYPLDRTVHIAVPDFAAGAMENWGLIIYRETALLFSEADSSASNRQRVAVVVAHELAHQWFGNLVTPAWWDDIWLNEGFASYMEYTCLSDQFPQWNMEDQFVIDDLHSVLAPDSLATSHPIYQPVQNPAQIAEIFDSITYNKGAAVIRMMKYFLGEETFRVGISNYLKNRAYGAAHHTDLFRALTEEAAVSGQTINVTEIMATWILQMGYPVIDIDYDGASGQTQLTQTHFLRVQNSNITSSPYDYKWLVPVNVVTDNNLDYEDTETEWLSAEKDTLDLSPGASWVLGNVRQHYYFRVNYAGENWQALIEQLNSNHTDIHIKNRAQLIDDSLNLGRAGQLANAVDALAVTNYLNAEEGYIPWVAARRTFRFLGNMLIKTETAATDLNNYISSIVMAIYDKLGWGIDEESSHVDHLHRAVVLDLACTSGVPSCTNQSLHLWNQWKDDHHNGLSNSIPQNIRSVVYCTALRETTSASDDWEWAFERFVEANVAAEKGRLLSALACSQQAQKLSKLLQLAIEEELIRRGDFRSAIQNVAANPIGKHIAWNFFQANWDTMIDRFGEASFTLSRIVEYITSTFSEDWEIKQLETFIQNNPDQGSARIAFQQAMENARNNMEWRTENEELFSEWLSSRSR